MKRPRDAQRSRLYRAEDNAFGNPTAAFYKVANEPFETVKNCQDQIDRITSSEWWKARIGRSRPSAIAVTDGRGARRATAREFGRVVNLPRWARKRWVILHELAHCL